MGYDGQDMRHRRGLLQVEVQHRASGAPFDPGRPLLRPRGRDWTDGAGGGLGTIGIILDRDPLLLPPHLPHLRRAEADLRGAEEGGGPGGEVLFRRRLEGGRVRPIPRDGPGWGDRRREPDRPHHLRRGKAPGGAPYGGGAPRGDPRGEEGG